MVGHLDILAPTPYTRAPYSLYQSPLLLIPEPPLLLIPEPPTPHTKAPLLPYQSHAGVVGRWVQFLINPLYSSVTLDAWSRRDAHTHTWGQLLCSWCK